jgi:4-hydroxy-tetrahydrodipicolinate reductase
MIKIVLNGCNGKMGRAIAGLVKNEADAVIIAGFDINGEQNSDFPVYTSPDDFSGEVDIIIDFSHPSSTPGLLKFAVKHKIPIVVATTGLSSEIVERIKAASCSIPVFYSANMSLGINLLIDLVKRAAMVLQDDFDIEIIERHHNQKLDAPSGTALAIADSLSDVLSYQPEYVYDRHSQRKKRGKTEIGIHAVRGGTITGDHDVVFAGNNEIIEVKHCATSREVFAEGAVKAAKFLYNKKAGMYSMNDLVESLVK